MTEPTIRTSREGAIFVIELHRPQALNALTSAMFTELEDALGAAEASDARALLVCSASARAFSVGTDLHEIARLSPSQVDARNAKARASQQRKKGNLTAAEKKKIDRKADRILDK